MIRPALRAIAHRLALALAALLVLAPPAGAVEVARIDGASLDARDEGRDADFCVEVETSGPRSGGSSGTCGHAPWRPRRSTLLITIGDERVVVGGAVPAAIARAEAELADGRRVAFDTLPGTAYRGRYAGQLRFFLAAVPVSDPTDDEGGGVVALRFFDAAGALQGVGTENRIGRPVGRSQLLLRQRRRGSSLSVRAQVLRRHAPTPLQLDRFEDQTCLIVRTRSGDFSSGSTTLCREPGPSRPLLALYPERDCGGLRTVVTGFVGEAVSAVRLRLGSGRVKEVRARTLGGGRDDRYIATAIPRGEAVRRADAVGASAGVELAEPPSGLPCAGGDAFGVGYASDFPLDGPARPADPADQVAAEAGGHRLLVRDAEDERLCVGVDRLLADGSDCRLPPVTADEAFGYWRSGVVSAVLPAEVARVRLPGGGELPTTAGGYTGRYASGVRLLLVELQARSIYRIRMLDSSGGVIGDLPVFAASGLPPTAGPVRLAAGRGWRLTAGRYGDTGCVGLGLRGEQPDCDTPVRDDAAFAVVSCTPRVAVLYGTLARGTRAVRVLLGSGRTLRARIVRVPRRFGGGRAFVLALPRRAEMRTLRLDRRRIRFPLLPAARQCGYRLSAPFLAPPREP